MQNCSGFDERRIYLLIVNSALYLRHTPVWSNIFNCLTYYDLMKKFVLTSWLLMITIPAFWSVSLSAGNDNGNRDSEPVKTLKGERPLPDYSKLTTETMIPGLIRIKIREPFAGDLNSSSVKQNGQSVKFGIHSIDRLNSEAGVYAASQSFAIALRDQENEARHRKWGLHLWYDLRVGEGAALRQLREQYASLPEVETAELLVKATLSSVDGLRAGSYTPNDSLYPLQWHYHNTGQAGGTPGCDISLPEAWELEKGDSGVIVSIMDQGVDFLHPDLEANIWPGIGYNFYADTSLVEACLHGTHVAGTIAANTNNGKGVSGIAGGDGLGNGVRIMSCQIISSENQIIENNIPNAYIWAADHGAAISQNSWNYPIASPSLLDAIDYFIANGGGTMFNGGIIICSAGNADTNEISYPACYEPCITVAATSNQDKRSFYSNYGPWVSISAPGGNYYPFNEEDILSTVPGGGYGFLMGTSMACPHVSGVAALVISMAKGSLVPGDVKEILLNSTDDISTLNPGYEGMLGSGRLNAYRALLFTQQYMDAQIPRPPQAFAASGGDNGQIDLTWMANAQADSLLLAYAINPVFGVPAGSYQAGDTIGGGGMVLFKGIDTGFTHASLDSGSVYHYRLWSLRNNRYSPFGRTAADTVKSSPHGIYDRPGLANAGIRVTPNPVKGSATLSFILESPGEVRMLVYDQAGRQVSDERIYFNRPGKQKHVISTSGWVDGIYTVNIFAGSKSLSGKMVVM